MLNMFVLVLCQQVEDSEFYRGARAKLGSAQEKVKEKAEATAKKHSKVAKTLQDTGNVRMGT